MSKSANLSSQRPRRIRSPRVIRLGYVQLSDAAPFIVADRMGLFAKYDLNVELRRELGWATVRDMLAYGELDAAQSLAPMPIASQLGLGIPFPCECNAAMVINVNGNAITLGNHLNEMGIKCENDMLRLKPQNYRYTLGVVSLYSSHHILLMTWLAKLGLKPEKDVRIVVIPPAQMLRNLEAKTLDGYCVGEPWNGAAIYRGLGWVAQTSKTLAPNHPEKVLTIRREFANFSSQECIRLIAALLDACQVCQSPEGRTQVIKELAEKRYLDCPPEWVEYGLGTGSAENNRPRPSIPLNTVIFYGENINRPTPAYHRWVWEGMRLCKLVGETDTQSTVGLWTDELYQEAQKIRY